MGFKSDGVKWTWSDTTTTGDPVEIKAPEWKVGDKIIINSPTTPTVITYGWVCPKCGCVNAPWAATCPCTSPIMKITC